MFKVSPWWKESRIDDLVWTSSLPAPRWTHQRSPTICSLCFGSTTLPGKAMRWSKECAFLSPCLSKRWDFLKTPSRKSAVSSASIKSCQLLPICCAFLTKMVMKENNSTLMGFWQRWVKNKLVVERHSDKHPLGTVNLLTAVSRMTATQSIVAVYFFKSNPPPTHTLSKTVWRHRICSVSVQKPPTGRTFLSFLEVRWRYI